MILGNKVILILDTHTKESKFQDTETERKQNQILEADEEMNEMY